MNNRPHPNDAPVLEAQRLSVIFETGTGPVHALDEVSLRLFAGRTLAVVGESGSGKTVAALTMLGLAAGSGARLVSGTVLLGTETLIPTSDPHALQRARGERIGMVFQEPMSALNPVLTIGEQVAEPLIIHRNMNPRAARVQARALLERVQIPDPAGALSRFPHQLSGGQRQRAMIAMAIACSPQVLIADEPTTALDVTVQAQVLQLLRRLQREDGMAMMLITHDFGVVAEIADDVAVLYAGRVVESGPTADVIARPAHPYTAGLLRATELAATRHATSRLHEIPGIVPVVRTIEARCGFLQRCPRAHAGCNALRPPLSAVGAARLVACLDPLT